VPHGAGIFSQAGLTAGGNKQLGLEERGKGRLNLDAGFVCVEKAVEGHRSPRRWRVADAHRTAQSVLECASPLALWRETEFNAKSQRRQGAGKTKNSLRLFYCAFCAFLRLKLAVLLV
jgi:hypothetical protein